MFYIVDKPLGISSNLVVKILKRVLKVGKIGFAGTLDPLATGLMIVGTEGSPRLFPLLENLPKKYRAIVRLDGTTSSYDLEKPVEHVDIPKSIVDGLTQRKIEGALNAHLTGDIMQIPPLYSAVWIDGHRAYDLARKGQDMTIRPKKRTVYSYNILSYAWPALEIEISVSSGTYIRSIARDLGIILKTGGYIEKLERLSIGHMTIDTHSWIQHNDIRYIPISHEVLFPNIHVLELSPEAKIHLRIGSTPLTTSQKNNHYFVKYIDDSYGLLQAKEGLLIPIKNSV